MKAMKIEKIIGIGLIRNHPINGKLNVYCKGNYNRYTFIGRMRIDRSEMNEEDISRRKLVQVEDAKAALRLSMVEPGEIAKATSVSFRHLALLAQTKPSNDAIWQSLISSGAITEPTIQLQDRLARMRYWISSEHFPEEMKIKILTSPKV